MEQMNLVATWQLPEQTTPESHVGPWFCTVLQFPRGQPAEFMGGFLPQVISLFGCSQVVLRDSVGSHRLEG